MRMPWAEYWKRVTQAVGGSEADFRKTPQERGLPVSDEAGHLIADGELVHRMISKGDVVDDFHHVICDSGHCHWVRVMVPVYKLKTITFICPISGKQKTVTSLVVRTGLTAWGKVSETPRGAKCDCKEQGRGGTMIRLGRRIPWTQ